MFKVDTIVVIFFLVLFTYQVYTLPSISTSTPTPCYGDVVTLVCHHPEVASNPGRYFSTTPSWREEDRTINIANHTIYSAETTQDLTRTTLTINITVDYFRNKSFNYSCLLVLAENGLPNGVETSEEVAVDPVEPQPPSGINNITSRNTSIAFNWTHTPMECYENRTSYYVSWVNVDNNTENGSDTTGATEYNITDLVPDNTYTISVQAVVDGNVQSTAESTNVTTKSGLMSLPPPPPPTDNLLILLLIIVMVVLVGREIFVVAGVCLCRRRKSRGIGWNSYKPLGHLQVTDSLNRNGVKIISIQGNCVSAECDPCHCEREATSVDIYGTFNEKSFIMTFLKPCENNMEGFIAELLQQKSILSADYCFALWAGGSVPRKVRSQFKKVPEWRNGNCAVVPVQGLPWKVGSEEEKRFVRSLPIEIEATHQVSLGLSRQEGEVTLTVEESDQVTVTIPHSDPPQVDVVKLVELLLISKPPTTEETDGDVKIPLESAYASVNAASLGKYEPVSLRSTDGLLSKEDTSIVSGGRRRSYTRASFIDGVVSVLEILHVTIHSVGNRCRCPDCQDPDTCTHLDTFQPHVVGVIRDASFVVKCVLHRHDGDVTGDHVATLNNVRTGLRLLLGLLVCDHMEGDSQLLSQQIPNGCLLVRVGAFTWDSNWVESTLVALCEAFKPSRAVDTHHPVHQVQYTTISVEKNRPVPNPPEEKVNYSEISVVGEKTAQLVEDKPLPVSRKKETNPMEEQFQTDIIEALTEIGMTLHLRELDLFTATYQAMGFLGVSRVETGEDVTPTDVEKVVKTKTKMAASRAVLICNQDTIPMDRLVDLQKASCYFIKAGGYGNEKWKNHLICNFKETVGDWMKEQNSGPCHSVEGGVLEEVKGVIHPEEEEGVGPPEEEEGVVPPEEEEGVVPSKKEEGVVPPEEEERVVPSKKEEGVVPPEKEEGVVPPEEEEGVGHPEEEEGNMELQSSVEEEGLSEEGPVLQPQEREEVVAFGEEDSGKQVEKRWHGNRVYKNFPPMSQAARDDEASEKRSKNKSSECDQHLPLPQEGLPDVVPEDRSNTSEKESLSGDVTLPVFPPFSPRNHSSYSV